LEDAARGGLARRPGPEELMKAVEEEHGESGFEEEIEVGEVGG
jgi:hypothetical protein